MTLAELQKKFPKGTRVKINLPNPMPSYVNDIWNMCLQAVNHQEDITLVEIFPTKPHWTKEPMPIPDNLYWVSLYDCVGSCCVDWLEVVSFSCNCSLQEILSKGCQNRSHI